MAINISDKYPGRSNPPSVDYPQGSIKNQTAPGARDGTPLDEAWANDKEGFFQKALAYRGATANGTPDTATNSQYFDALFADPTESFRGMPLVATQAETSAGADDARIVTPKKLRAGFSALFASNGYLALPSWMGGLIFQWGILTTVTESRRRITLPITFAESVYNVQVTDQEGTGSSDGNATFWAGSVYSLSQIEVVRGRTSGSDACFWFVIGK